MAKRKYELNEHYFDAIDTEEKAYWLGFLYADGYNNEKRHEIKIRLAIQDEDFLIKFRNTLFPNKDKPIYYYQKKDKNNKNKIAFCEIVIDSKNISEKLKDYGCVQAKTFKLSFPKWLDKKLYSHFIRGVFDGDGSICLSVLKTGKHKTMFSIIGYRPFMQEINNIIANNCGLNCNKLIDYKGKDERIATVAWTGCRQCIKIRDYLYKDATIFMQRKYDKFMLLGTEAWKTYENLKKTVIEEKIFVHCSKCGKKLTYKNIIHNIENNIYCNKCYKELFYVSEKRKNNNVIIGEEISILKIKENDICFDTEDIDIINKHKWYIEHGRVVSRQRNPKKCYYLNREIVGAKEGQSVAFKDGNRFNMKKENLELRNHR